jgi:hypothetical protein
MFMFGSSKLPQEADHIGWEDGVFYHHGHGQPLSTGAEANRLMPTVRLRQRKISMINTCNGTRKIVPSVLKAFSLVFLARGAQKYYETTKQVSM